MLFLSSLYPLSQRYFRIPSTPRFCPLPPNLHPIEVLTSPDLFWPPACVAAATHQKTQAAYFPRPPLPYLQSSPPPGVSSFRPSPKKNWNSGSSPGKMWPSCFFSGPAPSPPLGAQDYPPRDLPVITIMTVSHRPSLRRHHGRARGGRIDCCPERKTHALCRYPSTSLFPATQWVSFFSLAKFAG